MEFSFLNQLSNKIDKSKIRIRVSRMWDVVNTNNQDLIISDMTFIDEQVCISFFKKHIKTFLINYIDYSLYIPTTNVFYLQNNAIHSAIHKNISKNLKHFLPKGQLYALSNFEVGTYNEFCRPIQNEYKIIFLPTTNIQKLTEIEVNIPHDKFEFIDYNTIVH